MTTSDASWSASFRRIGELERPEHCYLTDADDVVYWGEYTARAGFGHSTTNGIIANLKKGMERRNFSDWQYKEREIVRLAATMKRAIRPDSLASITFVPIPPSKCPGDPLYDDRMQRIAQLISAQGTRQLIRATASREARHLGDGRRDPAELRATLEIDEGVCEPEPTLIFLIDDVITTGCSFKVCKEMLAERFPTASVTGMFVARRVLPPVASFFDDLDL